MAICLFTSWFLGKWFSYTRACIGQRERLVSEENPIRVFVTHTFEEDDDYLRVFEFLESNERFFYLNCSRPENLPTTASLDVMKEELIKQITEAEAVLVTVSSFLHRPELVRFQMDAAGAQEKPIIGIQPYGGVLDMPTEITTNAAEVIDWNERNMVDTIARHARLEETSRWEVIDFP